MMDENIVKTISDFKQSHPGVISETETDTGKILKFIEAITSAEKRRQNEKIMEQVSKDVDATIDEKQRLREYAAVQALSEPRPMERFITAYRYSHIGHEQILKAIIYSEVLKSSTTTKGLQPGVSGKRGSGKTHAARSSVHLLPRESLYTATLSPKALFYKNPAQKTTFFMDDVVLQDDMISFLKRKMTQFQEPTVHGIVDNKAWVEKTVDKRMVFIMTAVSGKPGDEQLSDRVLLIDIKNEKADDDDYYKFESNRRMRGEPEFPENQDVILCRDMLSHIRKNDFRVMMPKLDFVYYADRRLMGMCYDIMEASAILNYRNRKTEMDNETIIVYAEQADLDNALDFDMFRYSDSKATERLTKSERAFDMKAQELLVKMKTEARAFTEKQLSERTETNPSTLKAYLYGHGNNATSFKEGDGLCGKTDWYMVDSQKDNETESVKNFITIKKHEYSGIGSKYSWILEDHHDRS